MVVGKKTHKRLQTAENLQNIDDKLKVRRARIRPASSSARLIP
jgi:hypothetical protein